jgi:uncharacterized protein YecT (DUF1311 family)
MKQRSSNHYILLTVLMLFWASAQANGAMCDSSEGNFDQAACLSENLAKLERELDAFYQAALLALPETDADDSRKTKGLAGIHKRKLYADWRNRRRKQCLGYQSVRNMRSQGT